jgi:hypothetical protein
MVNNSLSVYITWLRFTNFKTLLTLSLTSTFPIKNSAGRENCDSRAWGISPQNVKVTGFVLLNDLTICLNIYRKNQIYDLKWQVFES